NADVSYNAAMALSAFGDEESVAQFIINCEKNYRYSHRIILELLDVYGGDMLSLARRIFEQCDDDYIKSTIIKGISDFRFTEFEDMYIEGTDSKNNNIKIACIKALGKIGKKEYEQALITASRD
ncbi:HEAT repeat domain-containing protein, partial [Escherichia coli]|nr:HEAT repeat domain-containing protein [Escherichia coli]